MTHGALGSWTHSVGTWREALAVKSSELVGVPPDIEFFFFQAEDGIRDWSVTGVQTCALPISPSAARVAAAISRIAAQREGGAVEWLATSSRDSGVASISSVFPITPCQPRSRIRSTISTGLAPPSAISPPWRIRSGEACRRSARTASNAVRLPWMSDTIAMRISGSRWWKRHHVILRIVADQTMPFRRFHNGGRNFDCDGGPKRNQVIQGIAPEHNRPRPPACFVVEIEI